uniref:Uncharacterized protein n=1 Tax=virus sp. ctLTC15 TaxID=2826801 RepID=A0A8S5R8F0_9VIRU|nr:MAG TPA: hypothetical protein [virus sp. ctLTC15]
MFQIIHLSYLSLKLLKSSPESNRIKAPRLLFYQTYFLRRNFKPVYNLSSI